MPGGLLIKGHGLNKPQKSTAGWLVARVSLMLAYAKTWHLKVKVCFVRFIEAASVTRPIYMSKKKTIFRVFLRN
ncbi:hypothetical protein GB855_09585 [Shigella flexneri]|nr:hypothetical protein [Shigella flexneri]EFW6603052.1 hypothetical protein [Shigella sonnei]EFW6607607.1 hypothetical protein [Shigella flexneri]EFW9866835.1 hypothetical protein [Shigella flexneri]